MRRWLSYARQRPTALPIGAVVAFLAVLAVCAGIAGALGSSPTAVEGVLVERADSDVDVRQAEKDPESDGSKALEGSAGAGRSEEGGATIVVDVAGAVCAPSVVTLGEGARVGDAIEAAGGFSEDADAARVNRAARLQDGQQVRVPHKGEAGAGSDVGFDSTSDGVVEPTVRPIESGALVDINRAGVDELDELPGIGPSTARSIVEDRELNGPFNSIEDLMRVSGIGEKKFQKLKNSICV